jgi:hypothetical protein
MIEISCTVTIESFHLMTFILENVLFAFNYFIVTTGTLIPSTTTDICIHLECPNTPYNEKQTTEIQ